MSPTIELYSELIKIFRTTIFRGRFCLNTSQEITLYWCDWFYFPVSPIWHSKECFLAKFLVKRGTRTPCTTCLKKDTIPLYTKCEFVMYRLKNVTHIYMKLYIYTHIYIYIYIYIISVLYSEFFLRLVHVFTYLLCETESSLLCFWELWENFLE